MGLLLQVSVWVLCGFGNCEPFNENACNCHPHESHTATGAAWETLEIARRRSNLSTSTVLEARFDMDHIGGLCARNAGRWECLEMELYFEINRALFAKCTKFNVCADPSTYGGHPLHASAPPHLTYIATRPPSLYQGRVVQAKTRPRRSYTHGR